MAPMSTENHCSPTDAAMHMMLLNFTALSANISAASFDFLGTRFLPPKYGFNIAYRCLSVFPQSLICSSPSSQHGIETRD
jgi:hypothetical protein